ncbi:MAG: T9SS type A sorting domain-containing protein, partial [Cyanothece sp. SIO1E1]|nr:T9SS type A sorting domain-containing protein [Cyanothece sp. SIO1E1]
QRIKWISHSNQFSQAATDFSPTFGDLDGDNDLDALIGEINGQLFYAENIAGEGQPMSFANVQYGYMDIDVGFNSRPQLVDVNGDQLLDLLIGEQSGNINYFPNQGTQTNPVFTADPSQAPNQMVWGGVVAPTDGLAFSGYSSPFLTKVDEEWQLFVGNRIGTVERYGDIQGNLAGDFTLLGDIPGIDVGAEATIGLANIGGDEYLNLIVGNKRGGIELWETPYAPFLNVSTTGDPALPDLEWQIVPNPSRDQFQINIKEDGFLNWHWEVFSADGQRIKVGQSQASTENISLGTYPSGVYWVRLKLGERLSTKKLLLLD